MSLYSNSLEHNLASGRAQRASTLTWGTISRSRGGMDGPDVRRKRWLTWGHKIKLAAALAIWYLFSFSKLRDKSSLFFSPATKVLPTSINPPWDVGDHRTSYSVVARGYYNRKFEGNNSYMPWLSLHRKSAHSIFYLSSWWDFVFLCNYVSDLLFSEGFFYWSSIPTRRYTIRGDDL